VDSPRMLTAIWKTDYTQLVVLMVVLGVVLAVVAYCRLAKRRSEGIS
jgi:RsiW-degrading membrane proteinase PrsW (M82 family)